MIPRYALSGAVVLWLLACSSSSTNPADNTGGSATGGTLQGGIDGKNAGGGTGGVDSGGGTAGSGGAGTGAVGGSSGGTGATGGASGDASSDAGSAGAPSDADAEDAPGDADASCSAETSADPQNCGYCGHDCLGGTCVNGACQPVTLGTDPGAIYSIATDGTYVYFGTGGTSRIQVCPTSGCAGAPATLASGQGSPTRILLDATTVYWVSYLAADGGPNGFVASCAASGCSNNPTVLASDLPPGTSDMAIDGSDMFLTGGDGLYKCPKTGCAALTPLVSFGGGGFVALDATNVVFSTIYAIRRCAKAGCGGSPTDIVTTPGSALSVFGSDVYFMGPTAIDKCAISGCALPTTLASFDAPRAIIADASGVYWLEYGTAANNYDDGALLRCPLGGCNGPPLVLASSLAEVSSMLASDGVSVYWAENGASGGVLRRVAKP